VTDLWLKRLKAENPWPNITALDGCPAFPWSLDGGGRELVVDLIRRYRPKVFLEAGVFLGGSALLWLEHSHEEMVLLAGDSWSGYTEEWVYAMARDPAPWIADVDHVRTLEAPLRAHGIFKVALHNLRAYRHRVIPLRMTIGALYSYVKGFVEPEIVYIDAGKHRDDYRLAHETFPNAILCGDDWEWQDDAGEGIRAFVYEVAYLRGCDVIADRATWVLRPK
jgi:hypothetical protein